MERFFQAGKKKRYAYLPTWKDGRQLTDPEPSISGFSSKRSDSATLTVETEEKIFDAILHGRLDELNDIVYQAAQRIEPNNPDWELIGIPGGLGQKFTDDPNISERDDYYAVACDNENCYPQGAHPRASYNANKLLGTNIQSGDKPMRVYLLPHYMEALDRKINVIGFTSGYEVEPIEETITVDVPRMTEVLLRKPLRETLDAVDVDVDAAVRGQQQVGLGAFARGE